MNKKYEIVTNVIETPLNGDEQTFHWIVQQHSWDELTPKMGEMVWIKGLLDEVIEYGNSNAKFIISTSTIETGRVKNLLGNSIEYNGGKYTSDCISGWGKELGNHVDYFSRSVKRLSVSNNQYKKVLELRKNHPNTSYYNLFNKVLNESIKKVS